MNRKTMSRADIERGVPRVTPATEGERNPRARARARANERASGP